MCLTRFWKIRFLPYNAFTIHGSNFDILIHLVNKMCNFPFTKAHIILIIDSGNFLRNDMDCSYYILAIFKYLEMLSHDLNFLQEIG